jgi:hypothetical protein
MKRKGTQMKQLFLLLPSVDLTYIYTSNLQYMNIIENLMLVSNHLCEITGVQFEIVVKLVLIFLSFTRPVFEPF